MNWEWARTTIMDDDDNMTRRTSKKNDAWIIPEFVRCSYLSGIYPWQYPIACWWSAGPVCPSRPIRFARCLSEIPKVLLAALASGSSVRKSWAFSQKFNVQPSTERKLTTQKQHLCVWSKNTSQRTWKKNEQLNRVWARKDWRNSFLKRLETSNEK